MCAYNLYTKNNNENIDISTYVKESTNKVDTSIKIDENNLSFKQHNEQSDPKIYKKPKAFKIDSNIQVNENLILPKNEFGKTLKECVNTGDLYLENIYNHLIEWKYLTHNESKYVPFDKKDVVKIATLEIQKNKLKLVSGKFNIIEEAQYDQFFNIFRDIIPNEWWSKDLVKFIAFKGSEMAAYVSFDEERPEKLVLAVNFDRMFNMPDFEKQYVYLHEFGHIFSMNENQFKKGGMMYDLFGETLDNFKEDSYMNKFYKQFWNNVEKYWRDNEGKKIEDIDEFYSLNEDNFVSHYASTNAYEDFAETFAEFILNKYDADYFTPQTRQKINFFYQYPEIVVLRTQILKNMSERLDRM